MENFLSYFFVSDSFKNESVNDQEQDIINSSNIMDYINKYNLNLVNNNRKQLLYNLQNILHYLHQEISYNKTLYVFTSKDKKKDFSKILLDNLEYFDSIEFNPSVTEFKNSIFIYDVYNHDLKFETISDNNKYIFINNKASLENKELLTLHSKEYSKLNEQKFYEEYISDTQFNSFTDYFEYINKIFDKKIIIFKKKIFIV